MDLLVVGSGLFGLTIAERAATAGLRVTVLDKRKHIGGNAYSHMDPITGIEVHTYGSHLFHTSNEKVWKYVNQFTKFNSYQHRVYTNYRNVVYPMPINLGTINQFFQAAYSPTEARELIKLQSSVLGEKTPANLEEKAISLIGEELYRAFVEGYTAKQWQTSPKDLPESIISRLPVRYSYDNRYFNDRWEGLPVDGYEKWLTRMADHKNITVELESDFLDETNPLSKANTVGQVTIVYSGPIDQYFAHSHGDLGWRTLDFEQTIEDTADFQGTSVMNYADQEVPYTRIHEFRHFHPERAHLHHDSKTVISKEYSRFAGRGDEPYYPVNTINDRERLAQYRLQTRDEPSVIFGGRLGSYQYLDMHMAIASALTVAKNELNIDIQD